MTNLLPWIAISAGFVGLIWSAERFVEGSATIANNMGVPKLLIGLTIVAFGTSAPEIVVSISASLKGTGELAIGNAIGSNLANIGLVIGITTLICPLSFKPHIIKQEVPIMMAVMGLAGWFIFNQHLSLLAGVVLVATIIPILFWLAHTQKQHPEEQLDPETMKTWIASLWFLFGLALLIASAETLVWGATTVAQNLGISPLIIGLTIVAIGTSLPELAASIISVLKGHHDIAIGNVIGSNIFNLLLVAGIPAIIEPLSLDPQVFFRDYLSMIAISLVLCGIMYWQFVVRKNATIGRFSGIILLSLYVAYYFLLI